MSSRSMKPIFWPAGLTCATFGIALIVRGLAPALVHRLASGHAPTWDALAGGTAAVTLGLVFVGAAAAILRGRAWALWLGLLLGGALLLLGVAQIIAGSPAQLAHSLLLLATAAAATCGIALDARQKERMTVAREAT